MFDIVTRGNLMERLQDYFHTGEEGGLYAGWHKFENASKGGKQSKYGIYVSWAEKREDSAEEETTPEKDTSQVETKNDSTTESSTSGNKTKKILKSKK